ncbi:50S ribosomal protein L23 [Candidatus Woesebacteria bacterium]|nr:50S ribosomal protein L23 [Candidatus Woesebacteria bacterium]|tara:strand:- start:810 stop:1121 length:312 start_codon:yes stop_codon:yes gene_type:complete
MSWNNVLLRPVISEGSLDKVKTLNDYTFLVARGATKSDVKEAIEKTFDVKVKKVRTKPMRGKNRKRGVKRELVKTADLKQAIVRLGEKDKIDLFEVKEEKKKQ